MKMESVFEPDWNGWELRCVRNGDHEVYRLIHDPWVPGDEAYEFDLEDLEVDDDGVLMMLVDDKASDKCLAGFVRAIRYTIWREMWFGRSSKTQEAVAQMKTAAADSAVLADPDVKIVG
jgi:hypothetical protein